MILNIVVLCISAPGKIGKCLESCSSYCYGNIPMELGAFPELSDYLSRLF
jgi:hypothetical protein